MFEKKMAQGKGKYKMRELNNDDEYSRIYYKKMKKYISANYHIKMLLPENNFTDCQTVRKCHTALACPPLAERGCHPELNAGQKFENSV